VTEIAVVRALALGDMLCAIPTLRSLRARFPDATITLVGLPWAQILVHRFPMYLDGFLEFPGYPGIPEVRADPGRTIGFLDRMQRRQWDLVVQLQGDGTVINQFVSLFGARQIAAFTPPGAAAPPIHDGETFVPYQPHGSEVDRLPRVPRRRGRLARDRSPAGRARAR
jgi:ADP-heptose:LPS heptosyltransferase